MADQPPMYRWERPSLGQRKWTGLTVMYAFYPPCFMSEITCHCLGCLGLATMNIGPFPLRVHPWGRGRSMLSLISSSMKVAATLSYSPVRGELGAKSPKVRVTKSVQQPSQMIFQSLGGNSHHSSWRRLGRLGP